VGGEGGEGKSKGGEVKREVEKERREEGERGREWEGRGRGEDSGRGGGEGKKVGGEGGRQWEGRGRGEEFNYSTIIYTSHLNHPSSAPTHFPPSHILSAHVEPIFKGHCRIWHHEILNMCHTYIGLNTNLHHTCAIPQYC